MSHGPATPLSDRVLAGAVPGDSLLDVGCGAGSLLAAAAAAGLSVAGIDAAPQALALAERAAPGADLRIGDAHELPFDAATFDVVTLVQVLEHLDRPVAALREAARVTALGGSVRASVWGRPDECDASVIGASLASLTHSALTPRRGSGRAPEGPGSLPLNDLDRLAEVAGLAGLDVREVVVLRVPVDHPDEDDLVAGVLASAPGRHAARAVGPGAVREAVLHGLEPYRHGAGYRLVDTIRVLDSTPLS